MAGGLTLDVVDAGFGVHIRGISIAGIDDDDFSTITELLTEYPLLVFRGQHPTLDEQHVFARDGSVERIIDRFGAQVRFERNNGLLTRVVSRTGYTYDFTYDGRGKLASVILERVDAIARHDAAAAEDLARQHVRAAFAERLRLNARRIAEREPGAPDEA